MLNEGSMEQKAVRASRSRLALWGAEGDAILVETARPWRLILWEKAQYVPCWDLGGDVWFTSEWMETHSPEDPHCYEPIMDKECRYSRARVVESGPARASVKWEYALCDSRYRIFRGNSRAEETYHVYPDGVGVRHAVGWPGNESAEGLNPTQWEVQEYIIVNGVGVRPEDCLEPIGLTLTNLRGDTIDLPWPTPFEGWTPLCRVYPELAEWPEYIGVVHLRDRPQPFIAFARNPLLFPFADCNTCGKPHPEMIGFPSTSSYSHWPANDSTEFVGWTEATSEEIDARATHTSFVCCGYHYGGKMPPRPSSWLILNGAVTRGVEEARALTASWLTPAEVESSHLFEGYSFSQRAYCLRARGRDPITVKLLPSRPIISPVLRVYDLRPPVEVTWDGATLSESECRVQAVGEDLVLWVDRTVDAETILGIAPV